MNYNTTQHNKPPPLLTAWITGSRRTAAHLYAADTQSAFHQAFGAGLAFNRNFLCQDHHWGGVSRDGKTKFNEISLCFWMDINHTSHSLAFLSSFCVGGTVGMGTRVPQTAPTPSRTQGQGDCGNERDDIEIGTPKIPKKEKSFVVSCICFLDHQLLYLLLVGSMSCTSLLFRSTRRALGNTMGNSHRGRGSSQGNGTCCLSGSGISAVVQIQGWEGEGD